MYYEHSQLTLNYPDSEKIWRYMDFWKFKNFIETGKLFFCRADKFDDDKWEGHFPKKMIEKFELDKKLIPSEDGNPYTYCLWQKHKESRSHLINCWHVNENESYAMWKIYSKNPSYLQTVVMRLCKCVFIRDYFMKQKTLPTIAIQSTIGRLKQSFEKNNERIWIGEVEYIDFNREGEPKHRFFNAGSPDFLKAFFLKWNYFEFEKEIRAVINKAYKDHKSDKGILVDVELNQLIECIYLSIDATQEDEEYIKNLIRKDGYGFTTKKSDLGLSTYM